MKHEFIKTVYMEFKPKHLESISISNGDKIIEYPEYVDGILSVKLNGSEDLYSYRHVIGSDACQVNEELDRFAKQNCLNEDEFWEAVFDTLLEGSFKIIAEME